MREIAGWRRSRSAVARRASGGGVAGSGKRRVAVQPEQAAHVVGEVGEADLDRRAGPADGPHEQAHPVLLLGEDVLDVARMADLLAFACAVRTGIGRPAGFLRWM